MITVDGTCPIIAVTKNSDHFNLWKDGGVDAISLTVNGANVDEAITTALLAWVGEQIQTREDLMLVRTAGDLRTAHRDGKLGVFHDFQGPTALGFDLDPCLILQDTRCRAAAGGLYYP